MRVAVLHHWFVTRGGGERVAECLAALFPHADLYSLLASEHALPDSLQGRSVHSSFLQNIPGSVLSHRHLMPLYPSAAKSLDLRAYDLIISSDSGPIKGARIRPDARHICYCHSPMRYLYDGYDQYRRGMKPLVRSIFMATAPYVRNFDRAAAKRVDWFIANSHYVADRIMRVYGRESTVIHPPIELRRARLAPPGDHYLCAGRLVGYKRTDIMIRACEKLGRPLRIAGAGPEEQNLRRIAGPNATFLGELSDEDLWDEYARCRALLFAADEDFGMVPLEVQACGRPVIAFGFGGSLETVRGESPASPPVPGESELSQDSARMTGMYFTPQTPEALAAAILRFEQEEGRFLPEVAQEHARHFDTASFLENIQNFVLQHVPEAEAELASVSDALSVLH